MVPAPGPARMLAIDWGTTGFRAYRLATSGNILESRSAPAGILAVKDGAFDRVLEQQVGDWIAAGEAPIVMSGMIGSRQGWLEVPYVACPAGLDQIATGLRKVQWRSSEAWIAPGVCCRGPGGVPDVMRGEEVQILGALAALGPGAHTVCLPGTHSKWVEVQDGRIVAFSTHMTGEVYAVMKSHSILGRMMSGESTDMAAFEDGVRRSGDAGGLLHQLFGVRARGLFGELADTASAAYLSGMLVGHEIRAARKDARRVHLLCTSQLAGIYGRALGVLGIDSSVVDPEAVTVGLFQLSKRIQ
jgi:2-dehydro-3-deoxygalactonokinase